MTPWRRAAAWSALTLATVAAGCSDDSAEADRFGTPADAATSTVPGQEPGAPAAGSGGTGAAAGSAPEIPTVGVGEPVVGAGYELIVHDVTAPAPAPDGTATPGPGRMLMTVDVHFVNRTAGARDATYLRFEVVDAAGHRYAPSPAGERPPTGWIRADVPQRVVLLYEVPIDATGLILTLRPDLVSGVAVAARLR